MDPGQPGTPNQVQDQASSHPPRPTELRQEEWYANNKGGGTYKGSSDKGGKGKGKRKGSDSPFLGKGVEEYLAHGQPQGAALRAWQRAQGQAQASAPAQNTSPEGAVPTLNPTDTFWVTEPELDPSVALAVRLSLEEESKEAAGRHQVEEHAQLALSLAETGDPSGGSQHGKRRGGPHNKRSPKARSTQHQRTLRRSRRLRAISVMKSHLLPKGRDER